MTRLHAVSVFIVGVLLVFASAEAREEVTIEQMIAALQGKDTAAKKEAAQILASAGRDAAPAVPALIGASKDKDKFLRLEVMSALGKIAPDDPKVLEVMGEGDIELHNRDYALDRERHEELQSVFGEQFRMYDFPKKDLVEGEG
ncbi:MAG: HEAT repeat domain-containing protein [Planctomycetota bacterium]|jgi:HEAT repeat protein